jgi:hypothetical protein
MFEIVNGKTPVFVSVTTRGELGAGKLRLGGARLTAGPVIEVTQFTAPRSTTAVSVFKVLVPPPMVVSPGEYAFVMTAQFF